MEARAATGHLNTATPCAGTLAEYLPEVLDVPPVHRSVRRERPSGQPDLCGRGGDGRGAAPPVEQADRDRAVGQGLGEHLGVAVVAHPAPARAQRVLVHRQQPWGCAGSR